MFFILKIFPNVSSVIVMTNFRDDKVRILGENELMASMKQEIMKME
jgi:hypothetical protein